MRFFFASTFPTLSEEQRTHVLQEFDKRYISLGLDKVRVYQEEREQLFQDFQQEMNRHREVSENLRDRVNLDPRIALEEMKAINEFIEKLMKEQAYIYNDGLRVRKAKFEEACQSMN